MLGAQALQLGSLNKRQSGGGFEMEPNGTEFLWVIEDVYEGQNFFDRWTFFPYGDPTYGQVDYVNASTAFADGLAYVTEDNRVIMKVDNTTSVAEGANRNSVRIQSNTSYNTSLIILDVNHAPYGCGVWPAFWTVGPDWPWNGEIDILEGVSVNYQNQITWHTGPECLLTPSNNYTGTLVGNLNCDTNVSSNAGCGIIDKSAASYGPYFDLQGGGVYAMMWDETGISVWNFYRAAIPVEITQGGSPRPETWGLPAAQLSPEGCDIFGSFMNQSIIFDITLCGVWAGNAYPSSCPGTCATQVMDPANFVNASWDVNYVRVYSKQVAVGKSSSSGRRAFHDSDLPYLLLGGMLVIALIAY
ncbi:glycoside hydrolase family 16 protein [Athelia psychrophila]|uniref:Glycoside hydrolase family 16 protein n=1 Tax=Athelia psychrophila TaxID=1759441 RepID=A0A166CBK8_9AGAM|nr:glycoside hydrolase family 16 protein [Fibularhizoctonia sp. CBS 109695]